MNDIWASHKKSILEKVRPSTDLAADPLPCQKEPYEDQQLSQSYTNHTVSLRA